jgi:hypothetical protein
MITILRNATSRPTLVNVPADDTYYVEFASEPSSSEILAGLALADAAGLVEIDPEECEMDRRDDGVCRIYLIPTELLALAA